MLIILCIFAPCLTNLITFMEKFNALSYVEKEFESFCAANGLTIIIWNDVVLTARGDTEFSSDLLVKLVALVNSWNTRALFADKHVTFRFAFSGIWSGTSIEPYLRLWFVCDDVNSYDSYFV